MVQTKNPGRELRALNRDRDEDDDDDDGDQEMEGMSNGQGDSDGEASESGEGGEPQEGEGEDDDRYGLDVDDIDNDEDEDARLGGDGATSSTAENGLDNDEDDEDDETAKDASLLDPITRQFSDVVSAPLTTLSASVDAGAWELDALEHPVLHRVMTMMLKDNTRVAPLHFGDGGEQTLDDLKVKPRIQAQWPSVNGKIAKKTGNQIFTPLQRALFPAMNAYSDIFFANQSYKYEQDVRNLIALHALNHVYNEFRDQGFTRPKVLILAPFRHNALQIIDTLMALSGTSIQENKKRFHSEFGLAPGEDAVDTKKPDDFRKQFAGNIDDCFRIGIRLSRKKMKLYSEFYTSDILVASPLGLKMIIGSNGDKKRDFDFLSSIEVVVLDQADVFLMQNWDHVKSIFDHLNLIPKDPHGCDFSRVRSYALDGRAKYVRQNIVLSRFPTPEINALQTGYAKNVAGRIKVTRAFEGTISDIVMQVPQLFHRIPAHAVQDSPDVRFNYFIEQILPTLRKSVVQQTHTLIFIPSYFDFVRVRNYLKEHNYSVGAISEYATRSSADRTRHQFAKGEISFLLCTERYHFFRRHRLRGVRHIVFYQLPIIASFYSDMLNQLDAQAGDLTCSVLFSAFDKLSLERVVGSARVDRMIKGQKDTFMFTS
ncbi:rRNA-binding ribosome biosynthesis protein utp25 [Polyrhizophydium stewartii]|uniref:U3 small nucleolar RNA-associated protein 25 n=1 Tax=Polyrhizophydium stewartii TaxID=2732419 RepID=A0ABR4NHG3_9FUNG